MKRYHRPQIQVIHVNSEERIASCETRAFHIPGSGPNQSEVDKVFNSEFIVFGFQCGFEWAEASES